jgi:hypothetical protein|tara:strand:- start:477 stop:707 length:231 start_codon:yes stop_codon:yes gene_type:complete
MMIDYLLDTVKKCLDILDNNLELLTNIEFDLNDKKNNELISDMELHNLFDMTEDVAEFEKIKRAESKLIQRQYDNI